MKSSKSFRNYLFLRIDSSSNLHAVLRSTHDPTNSPNADSRSTHDLRQTSSDVFESTDDPTSNLGCSDTNCCAQDNNLSEESTNQAETECSRRRTQHDRNREQQRKAINTVFNEVRQRAYVLGAREREILLIQQSIQSNTEGTFQEILRDTIHEGSSPYL